MNRLQEKYRNLPERFWIRAEIEEIVKAYQIDRSRFYEYAKNGYKNILTKFFYAFLDYDAIRHRDVPKEFSYLYLSFRQEYRKAIVCYDWEEMLSSAKNFAEARTSGKVFLILSEGWVYEGYPEEMIAVLRETDGILEDFYIVSPKFQWCAAYNDDGECIVFYEKSERRM